MPRKPAAAPPSRWLDPEQQRAWLAYIRLQLRMSYEMNRQLQADNGLSLPDYDVLTALSVAPGSCLPVTALAAQIGWERSRVSHHVKRMSSRGLVRCDLALSDRRVTEVTMTVEGRHAIEAASVGHVALVRALFFEGLPAELLEPFSDALEKIYEHVLAHGSLPRPGTE
jgi:DNA-binding MarR family transcriptional regulator